MLTKSIALVAALAGAGCLRQTLYKCETNDQCNSGGVCEANGYCSFTDSECAAGRRYGDLSGTFSGKCVGEVGPGEDGGIDTPAPDDGMNPDTPISGNCPGTYMAIGGSTKRYRVIAATDDWAAQAADCDNDGANTYLAVPDDQAELTSILGAAGANIWIGATDGPPNTEGMFVTSNGGTLATSSALWDTSANPDEPDNDPVGSGPNNSGDCVLALDANDRLADDNCDNTYAAVCECDP